MKIELTTDGPSGPRSTLVDGLPNGGVYQWTVPDDSSDNCYLRFTLRSGADSAVALTPGPFAILGGTHSVGESARSEGLIAVRGRLLKVSWPNKTNVSVYDLRSSLLAEVQGVRAWQWRAPKPGVYLIRVGEKARAVVLK